MTEDELLEQRAKRTGRKVVGLPTEQHGAPTGRYPGQADAERSPLNGTELDVGTLDETNQGDLQAQQFTQQPTQNPEHELRGQLQAALGRLQPLQQQLADREALLNQMQARLADQEAKLRQVEEANARATAARFAEEFDPLAGMSQDEIDMMDPATLRAIKLSTRAAVAALSARQRDPEELIRKTMQEQDAQRRGALLSSADQELKLSQLGQDPKFVAFLENDDSAGILLNSFVNAPDARSVETLIPRVRAMVKRYQSSVKTPDQRNPDPTDALAAHMKRGPADGGSSTPGASKKPLTPAEVADLRRRASAAARAGNKAEADRLIKQLN